MSILEGKGEGEGRKEKEEGREKGEGRREKGKGKREKGKGKREKGKGREGVEREWKEDWEAGIRRYLVFDVCKILSILFMS